jgi:hypothetical protein
MPTEYHRLEPFKNLCAAYRSAKSRFSGDITISEKANNVIVFTCKDSGDTFTCIVKKPTGQSIEECMD